MAQSINKSFTTGNANVSFKVVIGNAQMAASVVKLPSGETSKHDDSFELDLGPGSALAGKRIRCSTIVSDVRDETDRTSLQAIVTDGATTVDESRNEDADDSGVVTYVTIVRFR